MVVWKYEIGPVRGVVQLHMPRYAVPIHVGHDPGGIACLWAMVDPREERETVTFQLVGTGDEIPADIYPGDHVGSWVDGPFVWHLFCATERGSDR
jgi:hypothetical protein